MLFILWMLNACSHLLCWTSTCFDLLPGAKWMQKCKSLRIHVKKRSYNNINYGKKNVTGNVITDNTRTTNDGNTAEGVWPSYIYITVHMQQVEEEECPLGLPHRGRGTTADIRCRGEPAAAQIDFYHDTYYCQLTAGDRGAVSGCGVRRGWAAQCLMCGEGRLGAGWGRN